MKKTVFFILCISSVNLYGMHALGHKLMAECHRDDIELSGLFASETDWTSLEGYDQREEDRLAQSVPADLLKEKTDEVYRDWQYDQVQLEGLLVFQQGKASRKYRTGHKQSQVSLKKYRRQKKQMEKLEIIIEHDEESTCKD